MEDIIDDDMLLDGGMHLLNNMLPRTNRKKSPSGEAGFSGLSGEGVQQIDCVKKVADECFDLNQFISKMDELVYS